MNDSTFVSRLKSLPQFHWNLKQGRRSKLFVLITLCIALVIFLLADVFQVFIVNNTPSCPKGVYMKVPYGTLAYDDYVTLTCPHTYEPLVKEGTSLLKRVKAKPGDTYSIKNSIMVIGKNAYPIYHLDYLPQLDEGEYVVPDGEYMFLNDMPYSFDSRYMGPISQDHIQNKVILLINLDFFQAMYLKLTGGNADETYSFSNYFSHM